MIEMSPWEWKKWQDANWPKFMEQLNNCYKSDYCKIRDQGLATCRHPNVRSYGKECGPTNCFVCDNI